METKEQVFAYSSIHDFFDIYLLNDALHYLHTILKAAGSGKIWKKGYPYSALHFMQQLETLNTTAFYLNTLYTGREKAHIPKDQRTENPPLELLQTCTGRRVGENFFTCFPRHLTLQQLYDPFLAIKSYCNYKSETNWKTTFADILEYALAARPINDLHPPYHLLNIQRHLSRLLEALHLLELRVNSKMKEKNNEE